MNTTASNPRVDSRVKLESLCSYLPSSIVGQLLARPGGLNPPYLQCYTTPVLFADISGYTAMCEAMSMRGNRIAPILHIPQNETPPVQTSSSAANAALNHPAPLIAQTPRTKATRHSAFAAFIHGHQINPNPVVNPEPPVTTLKRSPSCVSSLSTLPFSLSVSHGAGGDELLAKHLNSYFEQLVKTIASHGGDVFKFAGDAILVLWPPQEALSSDPDVQANDLQLRVRRAAQCGMDIKTRLQDTAMGDGITLSMKVGVGVGELSILHVGGVFDRMEYIATGSPLLQAFAAEHQASQRDVVISPQAFSFIEPFFRATVTKSGYALLHECVTPLQNCLPATHFTQNPAFKFDEDPTKDALLMRTLSRYVPGAVLPYINHGEEQWASELRRITVLFVNLGLLTDSATSTNDELTFIQSILHVTQQAVYKYEGSLNKFLRDDKGSTLIAVFGLPPLAHEDDAVRGLLTALAICARLIELGLKPSVGVTTGMAFCGIVGTRLRREYSVLGDKVNLAARLMQHASNGNGGVLCDHETRYAAKDRLQFEDSGKIQVKGKAKPINVYQPYPRSLAPIFSFQGKKTLNRNMRLIVGPAASSPNSNLARSVHPAQPLTYARQFEGRSGVGLSSIRSIFDIFKSRTHPPSTHSQSAQPQSSSQSECFVFSSSAPFASNVPETLLSSIQAFADRDMLAGHFERCISYRRKYTAAKQRRLVKRMSAPIDIPHIELDQHRHSPMSDVGESDSSPPHTPGNGHNHRLADPSPARSTPSDRSAPLVATRRHSTPDLSSSMRGLRRPVSSNNLAVLDRVNTMMLVQDRKVLAAARSLPVPQQTQNSGRLVQHLHHGSVTQTGVSNTSNRSSPTPGYSHLPQNNQFHVTRSTSFTASKSDSHNDMDDLALHSSAPLVDSRRSSLSINATFDQTSASPGTVGTSSTPPTYNSAFNTAYASSPAVQSGSGKIQVVLPDNVSTLFISTNNLPTVRQVKEEVLLTLYRRSMLSLPAEMTMAEMMEEWTLCVSKSGQHVGLPDDLKVSLINQIIRATPFTPREPTYAHPWNEKRGSQSSSHASVSFSAHSTTDLTLGPTTGPLTVYLHHSPASETPSDQLAHYTDVIQSKLTSLIDDHRGGTIIVEGDVGLGKSLLLQEGLAPLSSPAHHQPHLCKSLANPFDSSRPLSVFRDLFLALSDAEVVRAGMDEYGELNQAANRRRLISNKLQLKHRFDDGRLSLDTWAACLNEVMTGLEYEETSATAAMSREERIQVSMHIIAACIQALAHTHPCVLVIDEAVFLDHHSWMLALALSRHCTTGLLLILATRPINKSNMAAFQTSVPIEYTMLMHGPQTTLISLQPRSDEFIYVVACQAFGTHVTQLPVGLAQFIIRKAHGNPLVVKELVYALQHEKLVQVDAQGSINLSPSLPLSPAYPFLAQSLSLPIPIPLTLSSILGARLDRLPYLQRMLLKCCAVIGEEMSERLLIRVWESREKSVEEQQYAFSQLMQQGQVRSHAFTATSVREEVQRELAGLLEMNVLRKGYGYEERQRWEMTGQRDRGADDEVTIHPSQESAPGTTLLNSNPNVETWMPVDRVKYTFTHGFMREMVLSRMLDSQKRDLEVQVNKARTEFVARKCSHLFSASTTSPTSSPMSRPIVQGSFVLLFHRANDQMASPCARWFVLYPELLCGWESEAAFRDQNGQNPSVILYLDEALLCDDQQRPYSLTVIPLVSFARGELTATAHEFTACFGSDLEYERWALVIYRQLATESPMPDRLYKSIIGKDSQSSEEGDSTSHTQISPRGDTPVAAERTVHASPSMSSLFSVLSTTSRGSISGGSGASREEMVMWERKVLAMAVMPSYFVINPATMYVRKHKRNFLSSSSWKKRFVYLTEDAIGMMDEPSAKRPSQLLVLSAGRATLAASGYDVAKTLHLITVEVDVWLKSQTVMFSRRAVVFGIQSADALKIWVDAITSTIKQAAKRAIAPSGIRQQSISSTMGSPTWSTHQRSSTWSAVARPLGFNSSITAQFPLPLHPASSSPRALHYVPPYQTERRKSRAFSGVNAAMAYSASSHADNSRDFAASNHNSVAPLTLDDDSTDSLKFNDPELRTTEPSPRSTNAARQLRNSIMNSLASIPSINQAIPQLQAIERDLDTLVQLASDRPADRVVVQWYDLAPGSSAKLPQLSSIPSPSSLDLPLAVLGDYRDWDFDVFSVPNTLIFPLLRAIFDDFAAFSVLSITDTVFMKFVQAVEREYRPNPFHSFLHAVDVCQTAAVALREINQQASSNSSSPSISSSRAFLPLDSLSLLIAALCHDVGHNAVNNAFHVASRSPLALIYNDQSVLESHHAAMTFYLINQPTTNILASLTPQQWTHARKQIVSGIMHTDMSKHFELVEQLESTVTTNGHEAAASSIRPLDVFSLVLHASDISNPCKGWSIHKRWTDRLTEEISRQRKLEQKLGLNLNTTLPQHADTIRFNATFVQPLYDKLEQLFDGNVWRHALNHLKQNQVKWNELATQTARSVST